MELSDKKLLFWCLSGAIFIIIFGSFLHFTYELSGNNKVVALFSPVNESVWEHLKMGFFSLIIFSLVDQFFIGHYDNYFFAKAMGALAMAIFIVVFFYGYTSILGSHSLFIDILLYVLGAILCQWVVCKILKSGIGGPYANFLGILILVLGTLAFFIFTFAPPALDLFKSPE